MEKINNKDLETINGGAIHWASYSTDEVVNPQESDYCIICSGPKPSPEIVLSGGCYLGLPTYIYTNGKWVDATAPIN